MAKADVVAAMALCLAGAACGQSQAPFVELSGAGGVHAKAPHGWILDTAKDNHVVIKSGDGSQFVFIQPFQGGSSVTATGAVGPLVTHWSKFFPDAQVSDVKQISNSPDEAVAKVQFGANGTSRANVLCYTQNGAGMLYAVAAPATKFQSARARLVDILSSFRYGATSTEPSKGGEGGGLSYTSWTDPNEQAFTVQVPKGWNVAGGLTRASPIDLRTEVTATSPDGQICAQYGEAKMLPFHPLTGTPFARGFHPGSISEYHGWFMFLDYETGADFSKGYLNTVLSKKYSGLQIGESKDCPELQQALQQAFSSLPTHPQVSVGQTAFSYSDNGQPRSGVIFATTVLSNPGSMSQGWVAVPGICTAPANKPGTAMQVLAHLAVPKWSANWAAKINQDAAAYTQVIQATARNDRAVSDNIYNKFVNQLQDSGRQMQNELEGTADVRDSSGHTYHVASGKNFYYETGGGVVGSNSSNVGLTPLTQF